MTVAANQALAGFCNHCGSPLQTGAKFCAKCGAAFNNPGQSLNASVARSLMPIESDEIGTLERLVTEHPGDESYQKLLAIQLHDDAMNGWWKDPKNGSYLCTTWRQIQHARRRLDRADALTFNDPQLRTELATTRELVESMEKRTYTGTWFQIVVLGIFYIFPGWIWWYVNRRPAFLINRDYVRYSETGKHPSVGAKMGGAMEKVSDFFDSATGGWGGWIAVGFMVICSPIFMILAYKQNYVDVKKEYEAA